MRDSNLMALTIAGGLFAVLTGLVIIARSKPAVAQQPQQPTPGA